MTSLKQIRANRRNALKSTGPTTEAGKDRSRRNAVRHGLTAETVVEPLEDSEEYKAFEISITSAFDAQTAVERELVLRLASVMWRLRRSTAIETGLLQLSKQAPIPRHDEHTADPAPSLMDALLSDRWAPTHQSDGESARQARSGDKAEVDWTVCSDGGVNSELALRFTRLATFDDGAFERLSRYETALWRQAAQLLFALNYLHRPLRRQFTGRRQNPFLLGSRSE
jgi:hypothetical protein